MNASNEKTVIIVPKRPKQIRLLQLSGLLFPVLITLFFIFIFGSMMYMTISGNNMYGSPNVYHYSKKELGSTVISLVFFYFFFLLASTFQAYIYTWLRSPSEIKIYEGRISVGFLFFKIDAALSDVTIRRARVGLMGFESGSAFVFNSGFRLPESWAVLIKIPGRGTFRLLHDNYSNLFELDRFM